MTTYIVTPGQPASNITLDAGDVMSVLSGGSAVDIAVNSGGELYVSGGGSAIDTTVTGDLNFGGQGSVTVFSGGMTTGTVIGGAHDFGPPQGTEVVLAGGSAVATTMSTGASLIVSAGGWISGTTESNGGNIEIGGTAFATTIENSNETVLSGGIDHGTTIAYAGQQAVAGSAYDATVESKGAQAADSGGFVSDTLVNAGGSQVVLTGGNAAGTVLSGGVETVSGTASNLTVDSGTVETVIAGGVTVSTVVNNGGIESISSGGTASHTTVNSGGQENIYFSGIAVATTSNSGAFIYSAINAIVSAGVTSSDLTLSNTGVLVVLSGGTMIDLVVSSGGNEYVSSGGHASHTTIIGAGDGTIWGTDYNALLYGAPPPSGSDQPGEANEFVMAGGSAVSATLSGGSVLTISSGGVASYTVVNGTIPPGVGQGDELLVLSGGMAFSTTLISGGEEQVDQGVTYNDTVSNGGVLLLDGDATTSAVNPTIGNGGSALIDVGSAISAIVLGGGSLDLEVWIGGGAGVSLDAVLHGGANETVAGGTAIDTIVSSGAGVTVSYGFPEEGGGLSRGVTSDTTILSGGTLTVGLLGSSLYDVLQHGGIADASVGASVDFMADSGMLSMTGGIGSGNTVFSGGTMSVSDATVIATTVDLGGTDYIALSGQANDTTVTGGGHEIVFSGGSATSASVQSGGYEILSAGGSAISATLSSGGTEVVYSGGTAVSTTVYLGGAIDLAYLTYADGGSATVTTSNVLTVSVGGETYTQQLSGDYAGERFQLSTDTSGDTLATLTAAPCYRTGTRIMTDHGEVAIEDLRIGDLVRTVLDGEAAPIVWIGQRHVDCDRHPHPKRVWPVRIATDAFGPARPNADLFLSPDHAVYVNDVLIPIRHLINGTTIAQMPVDRVVYYHIEVPQHAVVLAQGLPAESFLDLKDGSNYANRPGPVQLYPDFSARMWEAFGCARLIVTGPELAAARALVDRCARHAVTA